MYYADEIWLSCELHRELQKSPVHNHRREVMYVPVNVGFWNAIRLMHGGVSPKDVRLAALNLRGDVRIGALAAARQERARRAAIPTRRTRKSRR
jgi:hypothetical protein